MTLRDAVVALVSGLLSGLLVLFVQLGIDNFRDAEADRRENLRFIREQSATGQAAEVSFRGIDLADRNLGGLNLDGADLQGADLSGANLDGTYLRGADLSKADLSSTVLESTLFHGANFSDANLRGALLSGASFTEARLSNTDMRGIRWNPNHQSSHPFKDARFNGTNFSGVSFPQMNLDNFIDDVNFDGADLSKVELPKVYGWPAGMKHRDDPSPRISSMCFNADTTWPTDFPQEELERLKCEEMKKEKRLMCCTRLEENL